MILNPCVECGFRGLDPDYCVRYCRKVRTYEKSLQIRKKPGVVLRTVANQDEYTDMMSCPILFPAVEIAVIAN
jgi:hypothetical protein